MTSNFFSVSVDLSYQDDPEFLHHVEHAIKSMSYLIFCICQKYKEPLYPMIKKYTSRINTHKVSVHSADIILEALS